MTGCRPAFPAVPPRADQDHQAVDTASVAASDSEPGQLAAEDGRVLLVEGDHRFGEPGSLLSEQSGELLADLGPDICVQQVGEAAPAELCGQAAELAREIS